MKYSNIRQESTVRVAGDSAEFGLSFCSRSFTNNQRKSAIDDIALFTEGKKIEF